MLDIAGQVGVEERVDGASAPKRLAVSARDWLISRHVTTTLTAPTSRPSAGEIRCGEIAPQDPTQEARAKP